MSDELRWLRETCEAGADEARLRAEVQAWMTAEAERGCLRYNRDAPMWHAYEAARDQHRRAGATLNSVWPELLAVVEAAAAVSEHETRARSGGHLRPYEGHDVRTRLMQAGDALDAAIRRSLDGTR